MTGLDGLNSRLEMTEDRVSKLEDRLIKIKKKQILSDLLNNIKWSNRHVIGV